MFKAEDVKTIRKPKDISIVDTDEYKDILNNGPECTKNFLTWIKDNIKDEIRCTDEGVDPMKCETKEGSTIETNLEVWNQLPLSIRDQWSMTTINKNLPEGISMSTD